MKNRANQYGPGKLNKNSSGLLINQAVGDRGQREKIGPSLHHFNSISVLPSQSQVVQPKLKVNSPGDKYEQEADRVADRVVNGHSLASGSISNVNATDAGLQRKPVFADTSGCSDYRKCQLVAAWDVAIGMVNETKTKVADVVKNGIASSHHGTVNGRFPAASAAQLSTIATVLDSISTELNGSILSNCQQTDICSGNTLAATSCSANADVEFCSAFFMTSCRDQAAAIIHEIAHHIVCQIRPAIEVTKKDGSKERTGDVYRHFPEFGSLTTVQALQNPDSFAMLCLDLSTRNDCFDCGFNMQVNDKEYQKYLDKIKKENKAPEKEEPEAGGAPQKIQRKCAKCDDEENDLLQKKSIENNSSSTTSSMSNQLQNSKGGGQAMNAPVRSFMESRFGADFSQVRIHADNRAAQMSRNINALAFTTGNDIYFNQGAFNPNSTAGKRLLAHELTHTIQQQSHRN